MTLKCFGDAIFGGRVHHREPPAGVADYIDFFVDDRTHVLEQDNRFQAFAGEPRGSRAAPRSHVRAHNG
ncbi:MAG: hypothetical protein ABJA98_00990 [Acidobacteriota bacterium]